MRNLIVPRVNLFQDGKARAIFEFPVSSYERPEESPMERHFALLVFLASFLYLYLFRDYTAIDPDEGIILQGAERILRGQVLYRDFFSFFTPGSYYLLALLFKTFGSSILVARNALVGLGSILSVITYLLARRVSSRWVALVAAALATLTCLPLRFLVLHNWDSTLCACLALYSAVRLVEASAAGEPTFMRRHRGSPRRWAWALGSLIAITTLFDQSKGAGLALGLAAGLALLARGGGRRSLLRTNWLALGAGIAWPFLVTFVWFGAQHGLTLMLADWIWPLHHYARANHVPYAYQNWSDTSRAILFGRHSWRQNLITMLAVAPCFMVPVLPLVAAGILAYFVVFDQTGRETVEGRELKVESKNPLDLPPSTFGQGVTRSEESTTQGDRHAYYILVSAALSGLLLSVVAGRADILHFMYLAPLFYLVLAWILDGGDVHSTFFRAILPVLRVLILTCFGFFALGMLLRNLDANVRVWTRRGVIRTAAPDGVLEYVGAHVAAGSTILVYPYLPLYYYLTDTFSPTSYEYIQPGMHTREQMTEVARDLASSRTPVVLYDYSFAEQIPNAWPNTPIESIARDPIADLILERYRNCQMLNSAAGRHVLFMVRKDLKCSAESKAE